MGVWIETIKEENNFVELKVTPCVGVWIETSVTGICLASVLSHPAWVCGLKLGGIVAAGASLGHTLRGCVDWNLLNSEQKIVAAVTPCVGVWIETIMHPRQTGQGIVTPCVGVWIETYSEHIANVQKGHTLRGCVDWNWEACAGYIMDVVTPCVGVWIETMTRWIRV